MAQNDTTAIKNVKYAGRLRTLKQYLVVQAGKQRRRGRSKENYWSMMASHSLGHCKELADEMIVTDNHRRSRYDFLKSNIGCWILKMVN